MIRNKLLYAVILVSLVFFYILYIDNISLATLILASIFPVIQVIILFSIAKNITAKLNIEDVTIVRNTQSKIVVNIINNCILPVSCATATLKIYNTLTGEEQTLTTMLPVSAANNQSIKFSVSYAHCGKVRITLVKMKIFDYIKLFSKNINLNISEEMTVIPVRSAVHPQLETSLTDLSEIDEFSKIKAGDDCSEIFNIREYNMGDKLNRIHWNISSKTDALMVKEYSLPVSSKIVILFEFYNPDSSLISLDKNDASLETAMSISYYLIANNIPHQLKWYNPKARIMQTEFIQSEDDFSFFLCSVFSNGSYADSPFAFLHHVTESAAHAFSHTIYITPVLSEKVFADFSQLGNSFRKSFIYIADDSEQLPSYFNSTDDINAIPVYQDIIQDGIDKMII
ncbi:MAG: DUF58 domain-containing protein [Oscillospiraceae bacterium]|nr:DUF58 domain-containing protein [Oscillospiraceae bacterium]